MTLIRAFWKPLSLLAAIVALTLMVPEFLSFSIFAILFFILVYALSLATSSFGLHASKALGFWAAALFIVLFYHFCTSTSVVNEEAFALSPRSSNSFYNMEIQSWEQGQLSMLTVPGEKLLALANPYAAANREKINFMWDWSLYKGKYYIYWGIAPLLTFYLPVHLLTGQFVSDWMACFYFATLAFLFCILFIRRFWKRISDRDLDETDTFLLVLGIGLSSTFGFILRRPEIYESVILAANAYFFASLYFAELAISFKNRKKLIAYFVSGLCFALSVGTRPTYLFAGLMVLAFIYWAEKPQAKSELKRNVLFFGIPVILVGIGLAVFNYLRFDSIFEFGFHYQLTGHDQRSLGFDGVDFWNAWKAYLFNWPAIDYEFPFVHVVAIQEALGKHHAHTSDGILGMFFAAPLLTAATAFVFPKIRSLFSPELKKLFIGFALLAVYLISTNSIFEIQERFTGDFALLMQLPIWVFFLSIAKGANRNQKVLTAVCMFLIFSGIAFNFFAAFSGSEFRLFRFYPEYFQIVKGLFSNSAV